MTLNEASEIIFKLGNYRQAEDLYVDKESEIYIQVGKDMYELKHILLRNGCLIYNAGELVKKG